MITFILIYCLHFTHIVSAYDLNAFKIKYELVFCLLLLVAAWSLCITNCSPNSVLKSNYVSAITRNCHLTLCLDVHICLWRVFQIINIILESKV